MSQNMFLRAFADLFQLTHYVIAFTFRLIFVAAFHIVGPILHRIAKSGKTIPTLIAAQIICAYSLGYMQYLDLIRRVFDGNPPVSQDPNRFDWFKLFVAPAKVGHHLNDKFANTLKNHNFPTLPESDYGHVGVGCLFITMLIIWAIIWGKRHPLRYSLMYLVGALGATGIFLGIFTYAPYAMFLESPSSLIAWVLMLFVGNIEEFANIDFGHFCQERSNLENGPNFRSLLCEKDKPTEEYGERAPQDNTAFDLSRSYALTATWLSLMSIFSELLTDLRNRLAVRFASCVDVVVGDDNTALRLARHLVEDNQRTWRFEGWHRPDMRWPSATLDGCFSRFFDIDRIFARPRIVVLIARSDSQIAKRAGEAGVIVLSRDLTDTMDIKSLLTSRAILLRNLLEIGSIWNKHKGLPPRRIRLRRMYIVSQNPEHNLHIIHQTRSVFKEVVYGSIEKRNIWGEEDREAQSGNKKMKTRPAVVTVHGGVPRVILRLDSASESRSWITEQLIQYKNDQNGVPWLLDAVNTEEASAISIRSRLTYNPDRSRRRLTMKDAQHLVIIGSSPLTMALVDEIAWARQQAYELLRAEIRCYTRFLKPPGAVPEGQQVTDLENARALRVRQLRWLLSHDLDQFAATDEAGVKKLPRPEKYGTGEELWPYPHSARLEIPALQSIRLVGCNEQTEHLVTNTQFQSRQTPGLEKMLDEVPHPANTSCGGQAMAGNWIRQPEEYGEDSGLSHEDVLNEPIPQRIWIGENRIEPCTVWDKENLQFRSSFPVARGADLLVRAEADLRHILGLSSTDPEVSKAGEPIPLDEHVVVVFTEDTTWSHEMAHLIMAKRPDYTAALVRDPAIQGVHRPNTPDPSATGHPQGTASADPASSIVLNGPKQVARYGPSWVSGRQPIEDLWTRLARQNHNLSLSLHLEKIPTNAYTGIGSCTAGNSACNQKVSSSDGMIQRVTSYFKSTRIDTASEERGLSSRTPWHESPFVDDVGLDDSADRASRRYRTKDLKQLPEFFREEQYHRLSRTILNVQSDPRFQWQEVKCPDEGNGGHQHTTREEDLKCLVQADHDGWYEFRRKFGWVHGQKYCDYNREHSGMKPFDKLEKAAEQQRVSEATGEENIDLRVAWVTLTRTLNRLYALGLVVAPQGDLRRLSEQPSSSDADDPAKDQNDGDDTSDPDGMNRR